MDGSLLMSTIKIGGIFMEKKLYLSSLDKKIAGVCGGVAEYFEVDSTIIRLVWAVAIAMGWGILAYILAWAIIPERPKQTPDDYNPY